MSLALFAAACPAFQVHHLGTALLAPGPYCAGRAIVNAAQLVEVCVIAGGGAVVTVLTAIGQAALARLWFRHRIEVIRDEVVTAVLDGIVPLSGPVTGWLTVLEALAGHARRRDIELAVAGLDGPAAGDGPAGTWPPLTPAGRYLLTGLTARTRAAACAYLTWGRPTAWLLPAYYAPTTPSPPRDHDL